MKLYIDLDLEKCSACGACAVACMDQNDIDTQTETPFRNVFAVDKKGKDKKGKDGKEAVYASIACMHCVDAPCVRVCPTGALKVYTEEEYKEAKTGRSIQKLLDTL